ETGDVRGLARAGCEAEQHEFESGRCLPGLEDGGGGLRPLAEIGWGEAALAEVGEYGAAHNPLAQLVVINGHRDCLPDVPAGRPERGGPRDDLAAGRGRAAREQGG